MTELLDQNALDQKLKEIRLLSLDVDGIQTDGGLYYTETGEELRKFNVKDGMGIKELRRHCNVEVCIISASSTNAIQERGKRLGLKYVFTSAKDKLKILNDITNELGISMSEVAHMGDDLNDIPVLRAVGLAITVSDGVDAVKAESQYITQKSGGMGCVREVCDRIINIQSV